MADTQKPDNLTEQDPAEKEADQFDKVLDKIKAMSFTLDFMKDPEEAILSRKITRNGYDFTEFIYSKYSESQFDRMVKEVASQLDADPDQIRNPNKRTAEQQQALLIASAEAQVTRIKIFFKSKYYQAFKIIYEIEKQYHDEPDDITNYVTISEQALLYYFATHDNISPIDIDDLSEAEIKDIKSTYKRIEKFYIDNPLEENYPDEKGFAQFLDFIRHDIAEQNKEPSKFKAATNAGAIMTIGERLFLPSDKDYQTALMSKLEEGGVGLFKMDTDGNRFLLSSEVDMPFISAIAGAVMFDKFRTSDNILDVLNKPVELYMPSILKELGYSLSVKVDNDGKADDKDPPVKSRAENRQRLIYRIISKLDEIYGTLPNDTTIYRLFSTLKYEPKTERLTVITPYLQKLLEDLLHKEETAIESGKHYHLWKCDLLHSTAANERNKAAVEMAARILVGVQQRGLKPDCKLRQNKNKAIADDKQVTFKISCATLIEDCTQIREKLKEQPTASQRTQTLKRTFAAMYKILRTKSDLLTYYLDVQIKDIIPTSKTLNETIIIKHNGGNPKYERPVIDTNFTAEGVE